MQANSRGSISRMRLLCEERDRLWAGHDAAMRVYIALVDNFARSLGPDAAQVRDARFKVHEVRDGIQRHCIEHGCDAASLKVFKRHPLGVGG